MFNLLKYLVQYRFKDMGDLIRNEKTLPKTTDTRLDGKNIIISGATSGIGLETAKLLASKGANLILLNRDAIKSAKLESELREQCKCTVKTLLVDFSSLSEVRHCAQELNKLEEPIDGIIHNSGVYYTKRTMSTDGLELVFQVNHLASFLLTYLLIDKLKRENRAKIIYVNSEGHRFALAGVHTKDLEWKWHKYTGLKSYGAAKTAQILTMYEFANIFSSTSVTINAMHPGNVVTNIGNNNGKIYRKMKQSLVLPSAKSPEISAQALYYLLAAQELNGQSGKFYNLTSEERPAPHARDLSAVPAVWNKSLELCGLLK